MWIRRFLFVSSWVLCVLPLPLTAGAQSLNHAWSDGFGDANNSIPNAITTDGSGNVIVTGIFSGTVDFGGGPLASAGSYDIFVVKFNAAGNHLWSKRFGDSSEQYAYSIAADGPGNVLVTGYFQGTVDFGGGGLTSAGSYDIFVAKFDAAGNHLWGKRFGDAGEQFAEVVTADGSGDLIVAGYFDGTVDFGGGGLTTGGSYDIFVAKFDAGGNHLWSQRFGNTNPQYAFGLTTDGPGNVIMTGHFWGNVDFGGGALTSAGGHDVYVVKFDAAGVHLWSKSFGDADEQRTATVTADGSGNVIMAGYFGGTMNFGGGPLTSTGSWDVFVAKFDAGGTHLWSQHFGDANQQVGASVASDGSGNVIVTGYFQGTVDFGGGGLTSAGGNDVYVVKFDAAGGHLWSGRFGDVSEQAARSVATDGSGNVIVTGYFYSTVDFGGGPLTSAGVQNIFVAKFWRAEPRIACVRDIPGDQGGWVNLCWDASGADTPAEHEILRYTLWRAIQPSQVSSLLAGGASLVTDPAAAAWGAPETGKPLIRLQHLAGVTYYWYMVESVAAYYLPGYSAPVPTLFDSTAVSTEYQYFQVIAHTADPYTFWASVPDSGYSVDNLAPAAPLCLAGQQSVSPDGLTLSWRPNCEPDLACYAVYRGLSADFEPGSGNRIASPEDTTSFDGKWLWNSGYYYKVSAVDLHGNESGYALLTPDGVSGAGGSPVPPATYLSQSYPNPFRRSTRIVFGLEEAAEVSLSVYDVSGRLVRVLVDGSRDARAYEVEWDGTDARGKRVSSGVYFYRLTAGERHNIRKAVLLR
jgi:hypothetical protein